jgi:hypothetical protein
MHASFPQPLFLTLKAKSDGEFCESGDCFWKMMSFFPDRVIHGMNGSEKGAPLLVKL